MNKDIEYILNFDEKRLFHTQLDDECTNKVAARKDIKRAKRNFLKRLKEREEISDMARAFDFCGIKYTNTPHQALAVLIKRALKCYEYLWFLEYTADKLREEDKKLEKQGY